MSKIKTLSLPKMNSVMYLLIALLIANCTSQILSSSSWSIEFESDEDSANSKNHRNSESKDNKTKFMDLNLDVMCSIAEQLHLDDLLSFAEVNDMLTSVAVDVFARKYKNFELDILHAASIDSYVGCLPSNEYPRLGRIEIYAFETLNSLLSTFGSEIHRLIIHYESMDSVIASMVNQLISQHGSTSLTHLNLGEIKENTFQQFTVPFENLEHLSFVVKQSHIKSGQLPLNELFPKLSNLKLFLYQDTDYSFINCEFSNLKNLTLAIPFQPRNGPDYIPEFLRKNQQILSIDVNHISSDFVHVVHKELPNLERLKLYDFNIGENKIHFEHVKHFVLEDYFPRSIKDLSFACLESAEINYSWRPNEWIAFFKNHRNLSRLYVKKVHEDNSVDLPEFVADLDNLVELTFEYSERLSIDVDTIRRIFKTHTNLKRFGLLVANSKVKIEVLDDFWTPFENEWNIQRLDRKLPGLLFEKRN